MRILTLILLPFATIAMADAQSVWLQQRDDLRAELDVMWCNLPPPDDFQPAPDLRARATEPERARTANWASRCTPKCPTCLNKIAQGPDPHEAGLAEWVLALEEAHEYPDSSQVHIGRAALLLQSDIPIYEYGTDFLFVETTDASGAEVGELHAQRLPLLLLAGDLGARWSEDRIAIYHYTAAEVAGARAELQSLESGPLYVGR